jgi:putative ATPase
MNTLFQNKAKMKPLADLLRPQSLDEVVGQWHVLGVDGSLTRIIKKGTVPSLILWGPPGCGKTTIARLIANKVDSYFETVSAVTSGVADLKKIFTAAELRKEEGKNTLLMVDEIHRFNRAQQDFFLPYVENGTITLIGATTENPSFELNSALLSRCKVLILNSLDEDALMHLIKKAEQHFDKQLNLNDDAKLALCAMADGDGRYLLGMCEELLTLDLPEIVDVANLSTVLQKRFPLYDKSHDGHYNLISALHKSLRGSDVDASLYWFCRMLDGGEDPLYITRRLVRFAVEDIGLADPQALVQANAAKEAYQFLGSPEGELAIAQAVIYLATAPKSNAAYMAYKASVRDAKANGSLSPPKHILNAPTKLMKDSGYSDGYIYDPDTADGFSGQNYFPEKMGRKKYYKPVERGFERDINKRLDYWNKLRESKNK